MRPAKSLEHPFHHPLLLHLHHTPYPFRALATTHPPLPQHPRVLSLNFTTPLSPPFIGPKLCNPMVGFPHRLRLSAVWGGPCRPTPRLFPASLVFFPTTLTSSLNFFPLHNPFIMKHQTHSEAADHLERDSPKDPSPTPSTDPIRLSFQ